MIKSRNRSRKFCQLQEKLFGHALSQEFAYSQGTILQNIFTLTDSAIYSKQIGIP